MYRNKFLSWYSVIGLISCVIFFGFNLIGTSHIEENLGKTNDQITEVIIEHNLTGFEKQEYRDAVFGKLVDWSLQRQTTWGVVFLTAVTLFFLVLFQIPHQQQEDAPLDENSYARFLAGSAGLFLILACASVFQMAHYYRYVAQTEQQIPSLVAIPTNWMYYSIRDFYIIEILMIALFGLFDALFWRHRKGKSEKANPRTQKEPKMRRKTVQETFITKWWSRMLTPLENWTTPFGLLCRRFGSLKFHDSIDKYVAINFLLSISLFCYYETPYPEFIVILIPLFWAAWRIYDVVIYLLLVTTVSRGILNQRRVVILFLFNFAEIVFWFASVYRLTSTDFDMSRASLDSFFVSLNFSFHTMTTFGYTEIKPREGTCGHALTLIQSAIGVFLALMVFARLLSFGGADDEKEISGKSQTST